MNAPITRQPAGSNKAWVDRRSKAVSRGIGIVGGPLAVGYAVRYSGGLFSATHGYAALWPVIGLATLAAVPLLRRLHVDT